MKFEAKSSGFFRSTVLLMQMGLGTSLCATTSGRCLETAEQVHAYVQEVSEDIQRAAEDLISSSSESTTLENVISPWNRIREAVHVTTSTLSCLAQSDLPCRTEAYQALKDFQGFLDSALFENAEFMPYIHTAVSENPFIYRSGVTQSNKLFNEEFTVLSFNAHCDPCHPSREGISFIVDKILSTNADIICLQEVYADGAAGALYERLKDQYGHFYIGIGSCSSALPSGLFVASKYPIENPQFTPFSADENEKNYGFFDFVITDGKAPLGHFYTAHVQPGQGEKDRDIQLNQIVEKMQSDCLNTQNDSFPFFLCGNLSPTELGTDLIHSCFQGTDHHKQASEYALLLKSLPSFRTQGVSEGHTIDSVMIRANQSIGLLTNLKEIVKSSTPLAMREVIQREDDLLILCGEVSGSAKSDTDGSSSVEGRVSYENEESRYEVEVSGRVDRDSDGNYSGEVRVDFSKEF